MPPLTPAQQGSRAGLITALVVFVILFVTSTIFAIYYGTQWTAAVVKGKADVASLSPFVTAADMSIQEVQTIANDAAKRPPLTGIQLALQQRDAAVKVITGNPSASLEGVTNDTSRTLDDVRKQLKSANVPVTVSDDNLLNDLKSLAGQIVALNTSLTQSQADTKAANDKITAAVNERTAALAEKDKTIAADQADTEAAKKALTDRDAASTTNVAGIQASSDTAVKAAQGQTTVAQNELTKVQGQLKKSLDDLAKAYARLAGFRLNPSKALMRSSGMITRVPDSTTVFINLGEGQEISPGLTFEVYDKKKGLPELTAANTGSGDELPTGKASIEVIRVLPGTSECRVIKNSAGVPVVEGDLILNLIYNTHTKFTFTIYGDFDLANTGTATPGDADVMRRLVTQWGGRVMDQVTVDTDFLVMGKEPVVPVLPDNATPIDQEHHEKALKAQADFLDRRQDAIRLNIPILNQNRFLYFVGYYDQAKR